LKQWLKRIRGAIGMGLTWGAGGFLLGTLMEFVDPHGEIADIWPAVFAYPGFFGGVVFSVVLGIAARQRRFEELSIPRFAAWGALGGLLVSLMPAAMVAVGLATPNISIWKITAMLAVPLTLGSAGAASGSLALARMADDRAVRKASEDLAELGLTEAEKHELLGSGR
jgi:hypothetical protein